MAKYNPKNAPAKLPLWKRTAATLKAKRERPPVACVECYDTKRCPNCGGHPSFMLGCTVCDSTGVCPHCKND